MTVEIEQFICRKDNFGILVRDSQSDETAIIDAPEERAIMDAVARTGWTPTVLLITHHHFDHVEANLALKQRFGLRIIGPKAEAAKIPGIDLTVGQDDTFSFGTQEVRVIGTPGHTAGHVCYHLPGSGVVFTADTLFALGCGRLFEGTPAEMHISLKKLVALPADTMVYCGHEYTLSNARFARSIDPDNAELEVRAVKIAALVADGRPTLPTTIGEELATNPFMRWHDPAIRKTLGMEDASDDAVFAELRKRKDEFQ